MRLRAGLLLGIVALLAWPAASSARCLKYTPDVVTLSGTLTRKTMAGPPNYASIVRGDRVDKVFFLNLDKKICVKGDPLKTLNPRSHANLTKLQVMMPEAHMVDLIDKRVRITGSLLGAQSLAQRTPVVLTVDRIREDDTPAPD